MIYLLKYTIGNVGLATPIEEIREIVRPKNINEAAKPAKYVLGFFDLRDEKVMLYDLPEFLGIKSSDGFEVIISNVEQRNIGFKVTKVFGIIGVEELLSFPDIVRAKDYFKGVVRDNSSFLQVLSFYKILSGSRFTAIKKLIQ